MGHTVYASERPMRVRKHSLFLCPLYPIESLIGNPVGLCASGDFGCKMDSSYSVAMRSGYKFVSGSFPLLCTPEPTNPSFVLNESIL